jgi:hypothetical protein
LARISVLVAERTDQSKVVGINIREIIPDHKLTKGAGPGAKDVEKSQRIKLLQSVIRLDHNWKGLTELAHVV